MGAACFFRCPVIGVRILQLHRPLRSARPLSIRCINTSTSPGGIVLRPYQEEAIQAVLSYLSKGQRRLGISLATGAGKTIIFSQLIGRLEPQNKHATRTLILVHRRELVEQAARHCMNAYPHKTIDVDMGNMHASGKADITVASVMSLVRNVRLAKYNPDEFKLILVDEAHHIVASAYLKILKHFKLIKAIDRETLIQQDKSLPNNLELPDSVPEQPEPAAQMTNHGEKPVSAGAPALVGVSATLSRFDGLSLGHAIDHIVYHKDYIDLIGENWLSDVMFTTVDSRADLSKLKFQTSGDYMTGSLSRAVNTMLTNDITVRAWLEKAKDRKSTLVFCVDIDHVAGLAAMFCSRGVDARFVVGKTSVAQRSGLIDAFRKGEFPVLLNCGVFTEGTDIPNIDCVLLARPTRSRNLLVQMIGRGMRLHPGKENCHVIDMVSALQTGIVTVPTLFGLDPNILLENVNATDIQREKMRPVEEHNYAGGKMPDHVIEALHEKASAVHTVSFKDYHSITDLIGDTLEERHVRAISPNSWVHVGPDAAGHDRHILSGANNSYLTVKDLGPGKTPQFEVKLVEKVVMLRKTQDTRGWAPYKRPRVVAKSRTFEDAIRAADTYAGELDDFPRRLTMRYERWRQKPASYGQVKFLVKLKPEGSDWNPASYTAGQCADMIIRVKFGAKGQFSVIEATKARQARKEEKLERMKGQEVVRVGPLNQASFT